MMSGDALATVQIDNDRTLVTEWVLPPAASTGHHRHDRDYVVVPQTTGRLTLLSADGDRAVADVTAGQAYFRESGVEHDVANAGDSTIVFVVALSTMPPRLKPAGPLTLLVVCTVLLSTSVSMLFGPM